LTALAGAWLLKETITKRERLGMSLAFVGTLVTVFEPVFAGKDDFQVSGNLLVVGYIVVMAYAAVLAKKLVRKGVDALALTNISFIIGLVTILPFTLAQTIPSQLLSTIYQLPPAYHAGVWYMAAISGTLAYALWVRAQKSIEVSEAGLFAYLTPIFAAPLGILLLGEQLNLALVLGVFLIIVGVVFAEAKPKSHNPHFYPKSD
jgi:drug/metabolite transporter (DMT)-like permease